MSKTTKKTESPEGHISKADMRHKYRVTELADFTRRETRSDGTEKLMPRIAVLMPVDGGKQVRAYLPGNLEEPVEVGYLVMCRPHEQKGKTDGPPVKFRITNVLESRASEADNVLSAAQNVKLGADGRAATGRREDARTGA